MTKKRQTAVLVVGAGISGCVLAERCAVAGYKALVVEKRSHIGGNCYDYVNSIGLTVPLYGPHFFHTNDEEVWKYVSRFTEWHPYEHRVLASLDGMFVPIPVNRMTINKVFSLELNTEEEVVAWLSNNVVKIDNPTNSEESALSRVGSVLYEKLLKNYTKKQWDRWPSELDASVMNRIPVRANTDDRYFTDKYQGMPKEGYVKLFKKMLDHPNIEVRLETDFFKSGLKVEEYDKVFYTGRADTYLQSFFKDALEYRSLRFEYENINTEYFQPCAQVNYPNDNEYTRITEPKHATGERSPITTIIKEYPTWKGEPYYPVPSERNKALYQLMKMEIDKLAKRNIYFVGRLAEYKYYNMDQCFKNALLLFESLVV